MAPCLGDETIAAMLEGGLPEAHARAAREHLGGCDACRRADRNIRGRTGRRNEQRHIDPGLFPRLDAPGLSLVRAAGIWSRPGDE